MSGAVIPSNGIALPFDTVIVPSRLNQRLFKPALDGLRDVHAA
ncbi:hypothetical protein OS187_04935 [Xanthomonadaceae bacterium JHOS43]|nr:hypothetical protein [Xanthomonadaceae bacterium JHOS43]MCX7562275.1 hypothetical protein [Xanthomonadaceae bacterium XH05]